MKFAAIKVQRALRRLELSKHPQYMEIPRIPGEVPGTHDVHIQLRPDLPRNQQPATISVRNGSIYMVSRNVPGRNMRPGMVLLLDLARAASVLADDTYEIATLEQIEGEMARQEQYKKDMAECDRRIRMQNSGVENNINIQQAATPPPAINVTVAMPAGFKMVPEDTPEPRRRGRTRKATEPTASPAVEV